MQQEESVKDAAASESIESERTSVVKRVRERKLTRVRKPPRVREPPRVQRSPGPEAKVAVRE